ncbi:MAG: CDP-alcohol phosphatidyltransferase family protein [Ruminococcaceae bacterium]|nr:CDP-alcohol phosphatidyltransferase family protein [Oscillospiraceae bacterium]
MKLKNIPNILSIIRILLVFVFLYVFFIVDNIYVALLIFLIAGATDVVDGYLARRNNWITNLGKILDPFADKLMQCTVLVSLCIKKIVPIWFVIPFFVKEIFTLIIGLIVIKRRSVNVVSKWYGKLAVCLFYATIAVAIICKDTLAAHPVITVFVFAPAVIFALAALVAYVKHYSYLKKEEIKQSKLINNIRKEQ